MYNFLIVPDTQYMAKKHPDIFMNMTKTIVAYREKLSVDAVIQLGDIVDGGGMAIEQYETAKRCMDMIDHAGIPLLIATGNHDYDRPIGVGTAHPNPKDDGRKLTVYNDFFGINRLRNQSWYIRSYQKEQAENSCYCIGNIKIIVLEYGPRDEVLEWAQQMVVQDRQMKCIIITHSYMYHDGGRTSSHSEHNPIHSPETADGNDGEMIWEKFIKHHTNIIAVFSGHHVPKNISYRVDASVQHHKIIQSFQNWQEEKYGGAGRMRLIQYDEKANTMKGSVFNALTKEFEEGPDYNFSVHLGYFHP